MESRNKNQQFESLNTKFQIEGCCISKIKKVKVKKSLKLLYFVAVSMLYYYCCSCRYLLFDNLVDVLMIIIVMAKICCSFMPILIKPVLPEHYKTEKYQITVNKMCNSEGYSIL